MQYSNDGERGHDLPGNVAWPNAFTVAAQEDARVRSWTAGQAVLIPGTAIDAYERLY
jgi:hypothetical protein